MPITARFRALPVLLLAACPLAARAGTVEVFVLAGQSNATGAGARAAELPPDLAAPQPDVLFWFEEGTYGAVANPSQRITSGAFLPLQFQTDPSEELFLGAADGFGPEIRLGRDLADAIVEDVAIVKVAFNRTNLARDWNASRNASLYRQMRDLLRSALAELSRAGDTPQLAGFFWVQGESDAMSEPAATRYFQNLRVLIARLRQELSAPFLPFVFARLRAGLAEACCPGFPFVAVVRTAQADVARRVANTVLVDTDDLEVRNDTVHYDSAA